MVSPNLLDCPLWRRSQQLVGYTTATEAFAPSRAAQIADCVEDTMGLQSSGALIGTEVELSRRLGVGRRLMRQTSRILQQRGVVVSQRGGGGMGGLRVAEPTRQSIVGNLLRGVEGAIDARAVADARQALRELLPDRSEPLAALMNGIVEQAACGKNADGPEIAPEPALSSVKAIQLSQVIMRDYALLGPGAAGFVASLPTLCERYDASLDVMVEATRLLADAHLVTLSRGRGGGVHRANGGIMRGIREANRYLLASHVSVSECDRTLRGINIRMMNFAAVRRTNANEITASFANMAAAANPSDVGVGWFLLQRSLASAAASPLLHVMARCLSSSVLLRRLKAPDITPGVATELVEASATIARDVLAGRVSQIPEAHQRCQRALESHW